MPQRPERTEYAAHFGRYVDLVPEADILSTLAAQGEQTRAFLASIGEERSTHRYAPDKWSIREVVGHVIDAERVFTYRAMCFARGEEQSLPGFEEADYARLAGSHDVPLQQLAEELLLVRRAGILMFQGFPEAAWSRQGIANESAVTVRLSAEHLALLRRMQTLQIAVRATATDDTGRSARASRLMRLHAPARVSPR